MVILMLSRWIDEWKIKSRIDSKGEGDLGSAASRAEIFADLFVLASHIDAFCGPEAMVNPMQINRASTRHSSSISSYVDYVFHISSIYNYAHWQFVYRIVKIARDKNLTKSFSE